MGKMQELHLLIKDVSAENITRLSDFAILQEKIGIHVNVTDSEQSEVVIRYDQEHVQEKLTRKAGRKKKKSDMTVGEVKILQSRGMNRTQLQESLGSTEVHCREELRKQKPILCRMMPLFEVRGRMKLL